MNEVKCDISNSLDREEYNLLNEDYEVVLVPYPVNDEKKVFLCDVLMSKDTGEAVLDFPETVIPFLKEEGNDSVEVNYKYDEESNRMFLEFTYGIQKIEYEMLKISKKDMERMFGATYVS